MFCLQLLSVDCKHVNGRFIPSCKEEPEQCWLSWAERRMVLEHISRMLSQSLTCFHKYSFPEMVERRDKQDLVSMNGKPDGSGECLKHSCHFGSKFLHSQFLFSPNRDNSEQVKMSSTSNVQMDGLHCVLFKVFCSEYELLR